MKADLHLHSKYSDRPSEWFLRRIGAPECFSEPEDLYRHCRAHGMDFVTITDHNRVNDALTLEHVEKLLVLFNRFELVNGSRHPRAGDLVATVVEQF